MLLKSIWNKLRPRGPLTLHIPGDLPAEPQDAAENTLLTTRSAMVALCQDELRDRKTHARMSAMPCAKDAHKPNVDAISGD